MGDDSLAFFAAISDGNLENICKLLDDGADPNETNSEGETAIVFLMKHSEQLAPPVSLIELLLAKGADPNIKDKAGNNAVEYAMQLANNDVPLSFSISTIRLFLENGSAVEPIVILSHLSLLLGKVVQRFIPYFSNQESYPIDLMGSFAELSDILKVFEKIMLPIDEPSIAKNIVEMNSDFAIELLQYGLAKSDGKMLVSTILQDECGRTPLMWAAIRSNNRSKDYGNERRMFRLAEMMVSRGALAGDTAYDQEGKTAFIHAAEAGATDMFRLFVKDKHATTELWKEYFSLEDEARRVIAAMECGGDHWLYTEAALNPTLEYDQYAFRWTSLTSAARGGHGGIINIILSQEPNVLDSTEDSQVALPSYSDLSVDYDHDRSLAVLKKYDMGRALFLVLLNDDIATAEKLIKEGAYLFMEDYTFGTPLHLAAQRGHEDVVKLLISQIDIDSWCSPQDKTPIILAAENGHDRVVRILLDAGAKVDSSDEDSRSALLVALEAGELEIADLLIEHGADPNVQDKTPLLVDYPGGISALSIAADKNFPLLVIKMIEKGADIESRDDEGKTPLFYAVGRNNIEITKTLLDHGARVDVEDNEGKAPLSIAEASGFSQIMKMIRGRLGKLS